MTTKEAQRSQRSENSLCSLWFSVSIVTLNIYMEASEGSFLRNLILVKALSSEIQREID